MRKQLMPQQTMMIRNHARLGRAGLQTTALALMMCLLPWASCTCQRAENIEAKERLLKPAPPDPHEKAADDKIDVDALTTAEAMQRVVHMSGQETAARLGSFVYASTASLSLARAGRSAVRAQERTRVVQAKANEGPAPFSVETVTGDGSEMRLAFVNGVFFLKNNNGRWRMSRDPQGERNALRSGALGAWRAFYDLVGHALIAEKLGLSRHDGREVVKYRLRLPDESAAARAAGAALPPPPAPAPPPAAPVDGGVAAVPEAAATEAPASVRTRLEKWRERAKPAGGSGEMLVDTDTGVPLVVRFTGALAIGDGPEPSRLDVSVDASMSDIGKEQNVPMPKDAIEEVVRTKMPVKPRAILEAEGVVPPLPKDAGPDAAPVIRPPASKNAGEIPADEEP